MSLWLYDFVAFSLRPILFLVTMLAQLFLALVLIHLLLALLMRPRHCNLQVSVLGVKR